MNQQIVTHNQIGEAPAGVPCCVIPSLDQVASTAGFSYAPTGSAFQSFQWAEPWRGHSIWELLASCGCGA